MEEDGTVRRSRSAVNPQDERRPGARSEADRREEPGVDLVPVGRRCRERDRIGDRAVAQVLVVERREAGGLFALVQVELLQPSGAQLDGQEALASHGVGVDRSRRHGDRFDLSLA